MASTDFLPPEYLAGLLDSLPPTGCYEDFWHRDAPSVGGGSSRKRIVLTDPTQVDRLPRDIRPVWQWVVGHLVDPETRRALLERFHGEIHARFGASGPLPLFRPIVYLFRDLEGYQIRPHPDRSAKLLTLQLYLTRSVFDEGTGTVLFAREGESFRAEARVPFQWNSAYAFAVHASSWHGVDPVPAGSERNSLMLVLQRDPV